MDTFSVQNAATKSRRQSRLCLGIHAGFKSTNAAEHPKPCSVRNERMLEPAECQSKNRAFLSSRTFNGCILRAKQALALQNAKAETKSQSIPRGTAHRPDYHVAQTARKTFTSFSKFLSVTRCIFPSKVSVAHRLFPFPRTNHIGG